DQLEVSQLPGPGRVGRRAGQHLLGEHPTAGAHHPPSRAVKPVDESRASRSVWSLPFVATAEPPAGPGRPDRSVNAPPASVTIGTRAATSHSGSSGTTMMSTAPSATST